MENVGDTGSNPVLTTKNKKIKAKLTFDLTDADDITEFRRVNKSNKMAAAIFEFKYNTESTIKNTLYNELLGKDDLIGHVFEIFDEILEKHNIDINNLIS